MRLIRFMHPSGDVIIQDADQGNRPVLRVFENRYPPDPAQPRAERILLMERCFDELVEAASGVVENVKDPEPGGIPYLLVPRHNIEILKEILAKAGVS